MLVSALWVELVAQARHYSRAVPGTGTILAGPGRAWAMLFCVVPRLAYHVSAKWPPIGEGKCPLTHLCPTHSYNSFPAFTRFIPKD